MYINFYHAQNGFTIRSYSNHGTYCKGGEVTELLTSCKDCYCDLSDLDYLPDELYDKVISVLDINLTQF